MTLLRLNSLKVELVGVLLSVVAEVLGYTEVEEVCVIADQVFGVENLPLDLS